MSQIYGGIFWDGMMAIGHSRWMTVWLRPCDSELEVRPETVPYWIFVADHLIKVKKMDKAFFTQLMMFLKHLFFRRGTLTLVFRGAL